MPGRDTCTLLTERKTFCCRWRANFWRNERPEWGKLERRRSGGTWCVDGVGESRVGAKRVQIVLHADGKDVEGGERMFRGRMYEAITRCWRGAFEFFSEGNNRSGAGLLQVQGQQGLSLARWWEPLHSVPGERQPDDLRAEGESLRRGTIFLPSEERHDHPRRRYYARRSRLVFSLQDNTFVKRVFKYNRTRYNNQSQEFLAFKNLNFALNTRIKWNSIWPENDIFLF